MKAIGTKTFEDLEGCVVNNPLIYTQRMIEIFLKDELTVKL
jgi:hypothetical protein